MTGEKHPAPPVESDGGTNGLRTFTGMRQEGSRDLYGL